MGTVSFSCPVRTTAVIVITRGFSGSSCMIRIQAFAFGAVGSLDIVSATVTAIIVARGNIVHVITPSVSFPVRLLACRSSGCSGSSSEVFI